MKEHNPAQLLKSSAQDAADAVLEISSQITIDNIAGILFFCSSNYDLSQLSHEINKTFMCHVIGCTTAGEFCDQYLSNSIVALVLNKESFALHSELIKDIKSFNLSKAMKIASDIESDLQFNRHYISNNMFGFLLSDGLSLSEENIISLLYQALGDINILGGSAGDDLNWCKTHVFYTHRFYTNAAAFILIETLADFQVFRLQHFEPTDKELITTDVDFNKHIIKEINGEPAAIAYANINGLDKDNMNNLDFSMYPLMIQIASEWYIRSISYANPDYSLQLHSAIDLGLPLRIGTGKDLVKKLQLKIENILNNYDEIYFTLGCDCILRRLEIINKSLTKEIETQLRRINFIGFNSYGEQYNGIHFNQTLVAVVVGKKNKRLDNE